MRYEWLLWILAPIPDATRLLGNRRAPGTGNGHQLYKLIYFGDQNKLHEAVCSQLPNSWTNSWELDLILCSKTCTCTCSRHSISQVQSGGKPPVSARVFILPALQILLSLSKYWWNAIISPETFRSSLIYVYSSCLEQQVSSLGCQLYKTAGRCYNLV